MGIGLFLKISHIISYSPSEKVFISESIISFFLIFKDSKVSTCRSAKLTRQTLTTLSSVVQLCPHSLWPHRLQHARPPCPSPTPGACSNTCPLSQWCHPTISSSVVPFSSHLQSFLASGSFPMSQLFTSGGQSTGVSASASVSPMNIRLNVQDWFPLGLTGLISFRSYLLVL